MTEKRCTTCHLMRALGDFNKRASAPDGLQARCRSCSREWYLQNMVEHKANVVARNRRVRADHRERLVEHLLSHPCVDCGEADLRVLDFDHEDPSQKTREVGRLAAAAMSWQRVAEEISRCSVRCANCHRRRTAEMFGFWRAGAESRRQEQQHGAALCRLQSVVTHPRSPRGAAPWTASP